MEKQTTLYIDQYGNKFYAKTRKELKEQIPGRIGKMYIDKENGQSACIGYVIGQHWLTAYQRVEIK
jgi:hypothetical protein